MEKTLSEMSLKKLWQLFSIILKEYNPAYKEWYLIEKENILECLKDIHVARINHIGSSAVPGLKLYRGQNSVYTKIYPIGAGRIRRKILAEVLSIM